MYSISSRELPSIMTSPTTAHAVNHGASSPSPSAAMCTVTPLISATKEDPAVNAATPLTVRIPGLVPGDRWCVTAVNWLRAHHDGAAAPVVLASTHERALDIVPLEALQQHAVDVPADPGALDG